MSAEISGVICTTIKNVVVSSVFQPACKILIIALCLKDSVSLAKAKPSLT